MSATCFCRVLIVEDCTSLQSGEYLTPRALRLGYRTPIALVHLVPFLTLCKICQHVSDVGVGLFWSLGDAII